MFHRFAQCLNLILVCCLLGACVSDRDRAATATLKTVEQEYTDFIKFDRAHMHTINVNAATDAEAVAGLASYRVAREPVHEAFMAAWKAIAEVAAASTTSITVLPVVQADLATKLKQLEGTP